MERRDETGGKRRRKNDKNSQVTGNRREQNRTGRVQRNLKIREHGNRLQKRSRWLQKGNRRIQKETEKGQQRNGNINGGSCMLGKKNL